MVVSIPSTVKWHAYRCSQPKLPRSVLVCSDCKIGLDHILGAKAHKTTLRVELPLGGCDMKESLQVISCDSSYVDDGRTSDTSRDSLYIFTFWQCGNDGSFRKPSSNSYEQIAVGLSISTWWCHDTGRSEQVEGVIGSRGRCRYIP